MPVKSFGLAALLAVASASPAWAHHSHGAYVAGPNATHLEGTVKEVQLINPHSWIYLEVKNDKGETELWALEATAPVGLARAGVKKGDLRPGDTITVRDVRVTDVLEADGGFRLVLADDSVLTAESLVLATGVRDELPAIDGLDELWGDLKIKLAI